MKALPTIILCLTALTASAHHESPCLSDEPNACECVTAECVIGRPPAEMHEFSCTELCVIGGTVACAAAAAKSRDFRKAFALCQAGKTVGCIAWCN